MRLRRIEAVRFGQLADATLGELGDGLTVVLGPNEAGKSSFMALVRHVLYGFPTRSDADKDRPYLVAGERREGRLVFEEDASKWVVERTEGRNGGTVTVHAIAGEQRPDLVAEVCSGVSRLAFNVVFGFGIDELPRIESLHGSDDDIVSRLYAAGAGLRVSPHDVHATLLAEAGEVFTPRGRSKKEAVVLLAQLRVARAQLRELESQAESFAADRQRSAALAVELAAAQRRRGERQASVARLGGAAERLAERLERIKDAEDELLELRADRKTAAERRAAACPDERVLAVADELEARIGEAPAFTQWRTELREAQDAVASAERHLEQVAGQAGREPAELLALAAAPTDGAKPDEAGAERVRLQVDLDSREREAVRLREAADAVAGRAEAACAASGLAGSPAAAEVAAERLAALEVIEAAGVASSAPRPQAPAFVLLVSGVVALLAGLSLDEHVAVVIGAALVVAGGWFLLRRRPGAAPDVTEALVVLGVSAPPTGMELTRLRRSLDACRAALDAGERAVQAAQTAEDDAARAREALTAWKASWAAWLRDRGLPETLSPAEATALLASAREARQARSALDDARERASRVDGRLREYADGLATALRDVIAVSAQPDAAETMLLVSRARDALQRARELRDEHDVAAQREAELANRIAAMEERLRRAREDAATVLAECDLDEGGSLAALQDAVQAERAALEDVQRECDALAGERARLEERVAASENETRDAELRLEVSGLKERLAAATERYARLSVAAELVARTQARYERERQPRVVQQAQAAFERITGGRYPGLAIPLSGGQVEVFDQRAATKTAAELSRGTAEQMYLALRLGLIASLDDVGPGLPVLMDDVLVDFDPQRREGAADAIAELARHRQVVLFTCHPDTAELVARAGAATRIDLERR